MTWKMKLTFRYLENNNESILLYESGGSQNMEKEIQELLEENNYSQSDAEEAINFVAALLTIRLEDTKKNESYATNSIDRLNKAITEVNDLLWLEDLQ